MQKKPTKYKNIICYWYPDKKNNININSIKDFINNFNIFYPNYIKKIKELDFTFNLDNYNNFLINGLEARLLPEGLFVENILIKDADYISQDDLKVYTVKRGLRKTNSANLGFIDCTQQFKHEKPYMWSILKDLNPIIYNFKKDSFYLFFELRYKNKFLNKFEDLLSKTNYKIISSEYKNNSVFLFLSKEEYSNGF